MGRETSHPGDIIGAGPFGDGTSHTESFKISEIS